MTRKKVYYRNLVSGSVAIRSFYSYKITHDVNITFGENSFECLMKIGGIYTRS